MESSIKGSAILLREGDSSLTRREIDVVRKSIGYSPSSAATYDANRFTDIGGQVIDSIEKEAIWTLVGGPSSEAVLLDVGSGTGRFSLVAVEKGYRTIGLDGSFPMLMVHREKLMSKQCYSESQLIQSNALNLPFRDACVDVVLSVRMLNQLEHDSQRLDAIVEMLRVCKPCGKVVFDLANAFSIGYLGGNFSHLSRVGRIEKELREMFFSIRISVTGRFFIPFSAFLISNSHFPKVLKRIDALLSRFLGRFCTRVYVEIRK